MSRAILSHPSLLSYLGYCFFYASLVTGPSFDYIDYERFILTVAFDDVPAEKQPGKRRKRKIPKSGRIALRKVLGGLVCAGLFVAFGTRYSTAMTRTEEWKHMNFFVKVFTMYVLGVVYRLRYYAVWLISEGACIVAGLGYNGYDPKTNKLYWNRVQNIDPVAFELGQNVHDCLEAWNMNTNKWLKNSIYLRSSARDPVSGKPKPGVIPTFLTFLTSAFWHGTMPGYYLTFVLGATIQTVANL
ncbi:unnamed protein product [Ambrosiozyma monospora]|uniref:Unnamed protein product n=1 Tax=Ambrosiozyma monospora TaxID=43982 RepID=A0A9W7DPN8_AMBMO|nr:unnamed protein product [Ambrosiozyma monospora]